MWSILKALRENPAILIESQRKRGEDVKIIEKAIELDKLWRKKLKELNNLRHERNKLSKEIKSAPKEKRQELIEKAKKVSELVKKGEEELKRIEEELNKVLLSIPNILHESVPVGKDEN
ncbi:MAG TPA: serine--tRNA ligase, partial [Archaeoglobus profundus]|nr:serine--tRNA ligase [Archaeoglobus profundus]